MEFILTFANGEVLQGENPFFAASMISVSCGRNSNQSSEGFEVCQSRFLGPTCKHAAHPAGPESVTFCPGSSKLRGLRTKHRHGGSTTSGIVTRVAQPTSLASHKPGSRSFDSKRLRTFVRRKAWQNRMEAVDKTLGIVTRGVAVPLYLRPITTG